MKRFLSFLLYLFFFPALAFSQFSLSGIVKDAGNEQSLPGAHVVIENSYYNAISAADGHFVMKNLKAGTYRLNVSFVGYQDFLVEIVLKSNLEIEVKMEPKSIMEEEVVISATRASIKSPMTYQNISKKEIREINLGQDLPFLLDNTPSVVTTSDAGAGVGYTGIRIRGTDITRINVTINGIPLNDPESQGVFWVNMPDFASSVENVQIQRGVGTSTNGAAAFGASINIQTLQLKPQAYAEINSSAGSYNTFKNSLTFGTGLLDGKWAIDGRLSKITSDGYIDRASSDLKSFFVSGGYYGETSIFKINVFSGKEITYQAWNGTPHDSLATHRTYNPSGEYLTPDGKPAYYKNETDNYQQDHYQFIFSHVVNSNFNLNSALFYVRGFGYYENYKMDQKFSDYGLQNVIFGNDTITRSDLIRRKYLNNDFYGATFSANYNSLKRIQATFGGSWNYYRGNHYGTIIWAQYASHGAIDRHWYDNEGTKKQYNLFGKLNINLFKKMNLYGDLQLRRIRFTINGTHDDLQNITQTHEFTFLNPKLGLLYDITENQQTYFSVAVANREPTRSDYRDADQSHLPKAEKLLDFEAGYHYKSKPLKVSTNLFFMNYTDQLVLTGEINNVGAPIFTNVPKSYRTGIEFSGGIKISKPVKWEVNATFSKNKIDNFTGFVDNWSPPYEQISKNLGRTDLSFSPEIIANSFLTWEPLKKLSISLASKYVSKQFIDNTSSESRKLNPYIVHDLRLSYSFSTNFVKEISIFLLINNILSEKYESNAWVYRYYYENKEYSMDGYFPQATIHLLAGISLRF